MTILATLRNITRLYRAESVLTYALNDVSLDISAGEFLCIEGPSGCGKTTLLNVLGLLDRATGHYVLDGTETSDLSSSARHRIRSQKIGFVFQSFNLLGELDVIGNVALPLVYRRSHSKSEREALANEVLAKVGLAHRVRHFPDQLSGGEQQRVAVARALIIQPKLLLADEPTGNLDSHSGSQVMELLSQVHQSGTTVCMVTHDPRFARFASRTVGLLDGKFQQQVEGGPDAEEGSSGPLVSRALAAE